MPEPSTKLNLGVQNRLKLNLTELCLSASAQKLLYDSCLTLTDDQNSLPIVNLKDLPAKPRNALIDALNSFRENYTPSIQPGFGVTGENFRKGMHTLFGYDPAVIPNEAVIYINPEGGAGVGIRFKTDSFKYEFGVHLLPSNGAAK
ncbi:MAG: hypothetical protein R3C59_18810 [Planctomycetaceae bacterium]